MFQLGQAPYLTTLVPTQVDAYLPAICTPVPTPRCVHLRAHVHIELGHAASLLERETALVEAVVYRFGKDPGGRARRRVKRQ